ncbi:ABC transporter permease [Dyadobacter bucti]|uniref:ABC transporter permease n=1 Tax=Dyadobacter bucti TaxID=2572203 RepID=UPI003F706F78
MIRNYFKIAVRNLLKNKSISVINVMGLALGMAVCLLMYLYVTHEFEYDSHHTNSDRIARITSRLRGPESDLAVATSPLALADMLRRDLPEIETAVRMQQTTAIFKPNRQPVSEEDVFFTDANFFEVFTFSFLEGDGRSALQKPHSAVLTETFARSYFNGPALGKIVYCNKEAYQVTGVVKDPPTNSDLKIRVLLSKNNADAHEWLDDFPAYTFALFHKIPEIKGFEAKLHRLTKQYVQPELKKAGASGWSLTFHPEMLKDVHYSEGKEADTPKGKRQYNYLFSVLSVFVLLIALLNYVNLSTAKASERSREVGVRKVLGARRSQLIRQFLFDALLLNVIAVAAAVLIVLISIPYFNRMLGIVLTLNAVHGLFIGVVFLVSSMLAGFYPAIILSGYHPVKVLKGRFTGSFQGLWLRKSVTLFQFVIAAVMLICTIVV